MVVQKNRLPPQLPPQPTANPVSPAPSPRGTKLALQREVLRNQLWPDSASRVWNRKTNKGFTSVPRCLNLVMSLIGELVPKGNPARVYLAFWLRAFDEGYLAVTDEEALAFESGYKGTRAVRTWREHVFALSELGFIEVLPDGNREVGHVLLLNPISVCARLRHEKRVPDSWWTSFLRRAAEVGADVPPLPPPPPRVIDR